MCTVVTQWRPDYAVQILAVRDEVMSREFDEPGAWWPESPGVVGGRDRVAGGSWCVSDVAAGTTALVLNRTERRTGTPSRGVLPLAALEHGDVWPAHVEHGDMASFTLVLAGPAGVVAWTWTGEPGRSSTGTTSPRACTSSPPAASTRTHPRGAATRRASPPRTGGPS